VKNYVKTYFLHFDYGEQDFIKCEICSSKAVDIHHIHARSQRKDLKNNIINLMALCRKCHEKYGDKKQWIEFLQNIHNEFMKNHGK
jgi:uncharacterized protein with PIN domain